MNARSVGESATLIRDCHVLRSSGRVEGPLSILLEGGRVAAIDTRLSAGGSALVIDGSHHYVLPGLVNAHTHAHNTLGRGFLDNLTLEGLRPRASALLADRTPDEHYLSAALNAIEMVRGGCTAAFDLFSAFPSLNSDAVDAVAQAYVDVGLRVVLAPSIADLPFQDGMPGSKADLPSQFTAAESSPTPSEFISVVKHAIRHWHKAASGRVMIGIAPTIPVECSDEFLLAARNLSRDFDLPFHTHMNETKTQAIQAIRRWGASLVRHLRDTGILNSRFIGAHAVWCSKADIDLLTATGGRVVHNPASNMKLGSGFAPVAEMKRRGVTVALGTDGCLSSDNQNMFEAMRLAALLGKTRSQLVERWLGAEVMWSMATESGAEVLGIANHHRGVELGSVADLLLIRRQTSTLTPVHNLISNLVYAGIGNGLDWVLVGGEVVIRDGAVTTVDEHQILEKAQEAAERLAIVNRPRIERSSAIAPYIERARKAILEEPYLVERFASNQDSADE